MQNAFPPVLTCPSAGNRAEAHCRLQFIGHCLFRKPIKRRQKVGVVPQLKKNQSMRVRAAGGDIAWFTSAWFGDVCNVMIEGLELTDASHPGS